MLFGYLLTVSVLCCDMKTLKYKQDYFCFGLVKSIYKPTLIVVALSNSLCEWIFYVRQKYINLHRDIVWSDFECHCFRQDELIKKYQSL